MGFLGPGGAWVDVPSGLGLEALAPGRSKMAASGPREGWPSVRGLAWSPCDWLEVQRGLAFSPGAGHRSGGLAACLQGWLKSPQDH